jgi:zinc transport system ATP-binding protein
MTVLMVTHDIGEVTHFSDRIACVNHTLHWHDEPSKLGEEVLQSVYACELNAYRLRHDEICPIH